MSKLKRESIEDGIEDNINKQIIEASLNRKCKCQKK